MIGIIVMLCIMHYYTITLVTACYLCFDFYIT